MSTVRHTFPSWKTTKTEAGFVGTVIKCEALNERMSDGSFCDHTIVQKATFSSRAKAKTWAQKWTRYYRHHGFNG
jgi:hypothetical protein